MRIVTPICIFFVRRAVRSPLCVTLPLYHSKVLYSFYLHFMHTLRQSFGRKLRSFVAWRVFKMPALCSEDFAPMELIRARLVRTTTCADGCKCDYTICGDRDEYLKLHPEYRDEAGYRRNRR